MPFYFPPTPLFEHHLPTPFVEEKWIDISPVSTVIQTRTSHSYHSYPYIGPIVPAVPVFRLEPVYFSSCHTPCTTVERRAERMEERRDERDEWPSGGLRLSFELCGKKDKSKKGCDGRGITESMEREDIRARIRSLEDKVRDLQDSRPSRITEVFDSDPLPSKRASLASLQLQLRESELLLQKREDEARREEAQKKIREEQVRKKWVDEEREERKREVSLDCQIEDVRARLAEVEARLRAAEERGAARDERFRAGEERVSGLEGRVGGLEVKVGRLEYPSRIN